MKSEETYQCETVPPAAKLVCASLPRSAFSDGCGVSRDPANARLGAFCARLVSE